METRYKYSNGNLVFKVGDKVVHISDPEYKGVVTKAVRLNSREAQWLWIDGHMSGCTSEYFKLDEQ